MNAIGKSLIKKSLKTDTEKYERKRWARCQSTTVMKIMPTLKPNKPEVRVSSSIEAAPISKNMIN